MHEIDVLGLLFDQLGRQRLDLRVLRRLHDRGEVGQRALLARERELQGMPGRHQIVSGIKLGLFRAVAAAKSCNLAGARGHVEIAREPADFLAMDAFGAGQIAEDLDQLRIVVSCLLYTSDAADE